MNFIDKLTKRVLESYEEKKRCSYILKEVDNGWIISSNDYSYPSVSEKVAKTFQEAISTLKQMHGERKK